MRKNPGLAAVDRRGRRAFTLIEIIVVVAMVVLIAGLAVSNMGDFVPALEKPSVEKAVERVCTLAAHSAWTKKKKFSVRYDPDENKIVVEDAAGAVVESFEASEGALSVKIFADPRDGSKIFVPAQMTEIFRIEFSPAGCATPAVISIQKDGRATKIFQLDPFSGGLYERTVL